MEAQISNEKQTSAIERALAAAKARKAASAAAETETTTAAEPTLKKQRPDAETRSATRAAREAERAASKAARAAEREARRAAKLAAAAAEKRSPAHMKKVERARAKCPPLSSAAETVFGDITANFSAAQIDALAQHLLVHNRATATARATALPPLPMGAVVRITGGEAKFIGAVGKVVHSQKLRAKVAVDGVKNPVYIYNGQAELVAAETPTAAVG